MAEEGYNLSSALRLNGTRTEILLDITHFNYPWILLFLFLATFVVNSILSVESASETVITGPGGKPLPRSAKKVKEAKEKKKLQDFTPGRKLLFIWLSAGLVTTFVANATNIIAHALTKRESGWWCGEATAISYLVCILSINNDGDEYTSPSLHSEAARVFGYPSGSPQAEFLIAFLRGISFH